MPVQVSYPGVYIQEVSSGSRTITGVSTSVALFIGMADQGPIDTPIRTLSFTEFQRTYGATNSSGELHDQVSQFFLNGGSQAWIMRIADGAIAAAVTLEAEDETTQVLTLAAKSPGVIGNSLRALVDYDTPSPESTFNLTIQRWGVGTGGNLEAQASETFSNVSMNPNAGNYAIDVINAESDLATAEAVAGTTQNGYSVWGLLEQGIASTTVLTDLLNTLPGKIGYFTISVDDGPFVTVPLDYNAISTDTDIESAINTALNPLGTSVTVGRTRVDSVSGVDATDYFAYRIISTTDGGSVRCAPAVTNDIAVTMQAGVAQGGIEVDGYAGLRPAPTGIFGLLDVKTHANFETALQAIAEVDTTSINPINVNDKDGATGFSVTWPATDTVLTVGSITAGTGRSLRNLHENLEALTAGIKANASTNWNVKLQGYRLVMTAKYGGDSGALTAFLSSNSPNLNAAGGYMSATSNVTRYDFGSSPAGTYQTSAATGNDGASLPSTTNYDDAYVIAAREVDLFNILMLPKSGTQGDSQRAELWGPASVFAASERAILIVDPPKAWTTRDDVDANIANLRIGLVKDHCAIYWPRISLGTKTIDPAGAMAGVMARTDSARGVWKAPAGLEASLLGVRGVEHGMSDADNGVINPQAVNAIRAFPSGIVSWGARTMDGFDNSGNDDYKYLPVRRLALYIEESLYRGLQFAVFEPNDEPLWRQLRQAAGGFMNNLFRLGAFAGAKAKDAYFIKVDRETTTQNDINLGIVNVMIGFAPLKPAEFVVITLQQQAGEVQT